MSRSNLERPVAFGRSLLGVVVTIQLLLSIAGGYERDFSTIALTGEPIPDSPKGELFRSMFSPTINARGDVLFLGNDAVYSTATGSLETVIEEGDLFSFVSSRWTLGDRGHIAGTGVLASASPRSKQCSGAKFGQEIDIIAREGMPLGDDFQLDSFFSRNPTVTSAGDVLLPVELRGNVSTENDSAIFRASSSGFDLVAREGDLSPVPGTTYGSRRFGYVVTDGAGQIAFDAPLIGAGPDSAVFSDRHGSLAAEYQQGQVVNVDGQPRLLESIEWGTQISSSGRLSLSNRRRHPGRRR